jgi:hypothetical protein
MGDSEEKHAVRATTAKALGILAGLAVGLSAATSIARADVDPRPTDMDTPPPADMGSGAREDDGGCSVTTPAGRGVLGVFVVAGAVVALTVARRRRS